MFRDNNVYVNSGNNGRTYQAYFYDPSNGLGSWINSGVITSTSFSTTPADRINYSLFYANQHFVSSTYNGLAGSQNINQNWNDSSWGWDTLSNITGADYSDASFNGLDRTGGSSGSKMRWIAYKRTYNSTGTSTFDLNNLKINDNIFNGGSYTWGEHYEAYVYREGLGYANLNYVVNTISSGSIYGNSNINSAYLTSTSDPAYGAVISSTNNTLQPHAGSGNYPSHDIYFIIGLKADSDLRITHVPS